MEREKEKRESGFVVWLWKVKIKVKGMETVEECDWFGLVLFCLFLLHVVPDA